VSLADVFFNAVRGPEPERSTRLATVIEAGDLSARVRFDGETLDSPKWYRTVTPVQFGWRVLLTRSGRTWVILGSVSHTAGYLPEADFNGLFDTRVDSIDQNLSAAFTDPVNAFPDRVSVRFMGDGPGAPIPGRSWTVTTAKRSSTVVAQTAQARDSTTVVTVPSYTRHGYAGGGGGDWGPWQQITPVPYSGARVFLDANFVIPSGVTEYVPFTSAGIMHDTDAYASDLVATAGRLRVPTAGKYRVDAGVRHNYQTDPSWVVDLYAPALAARVRPYSTPTSSAQSYLLSSGVTTCAANDLIGLRTAQFDGGNRTIYGGADWQTWLSVEKIG